MSTDTFDAVFSRLEPWTEADYLELPDLPGRVELVDGSLLVNPPPAYPHQRLVLAIANLLNGTCPDQAWEALPGPGVRLWRDHIRIPDVVVVRSGLQGRLADVADVLVLVEITSPGNFRQDMIVKHGDYAEAGVPYYLRVDQHRGPDAVSASAFELAGGTYREYATAPDGVLTLDRPWSLQADLRQLARGR